MKNNHVKKLYSKLPESIFDFVKVFKTKHSMADLENFSKFEPIDAYIRRSADILSINPRRPFTPVPSRIKLVHICAKMDQTIDLSGGNYTHIFIDTVNFYNNFLTKLKINTKMDITNNFNRIFHKWVPKQNLTYKTAAMFFKDINSAEDMEKLKDILRPSHYTFVVHMPFLASQRDVVIPTSYAVTVDTLHMSEDNPGVAEFIKLSYGNRLNDLVPFNTIFIQALKTTTIKDKHSQQYIRMVLDDTDENVMEHLVGMNNSTYDTVNKPYADPLDPESDTFERIRAAINIVLYKMTFGDCIGHSVPSDAVFYNNCKKEINRVEHFKVSKRILHSGESKNTHFRSGHFRTLASDFYKSKKGTTIWINATVVNRKGRIETIHENLNGVAV